MLIAQCYICAGGVAVFLADTVRFGVWRCVQTDLQIFF